METPQNTGAQNNEPQKKNNTVLILILIAALAAGGFWFWRTEEAKKEAASQRTELPPVTVREMTIARGDVPITFEYTGQTNGYRQAEVRAQVGGILIEKNYQEGQMVKKGQLLFKIDPAPYREALNRARGTLKQGQAQMNFAKIEYDRVSSLYKQNAASKNDFDTADANLKSTRAAVESAQAAVKQAQIDLGWTSVTAPISGVSSKENRSVGNLVTLDSAGSHLTTIVQVDPIYVDFAIPADEHRRNENFRTSGVIRTAPEGVTVRVALGDGAEYPQKGKIDFQDQFVDAATATIRARALFDNKGNQLYPGQFVRVFVDGYYVNDIIKVPLRATVKMSNATVVYVLDEQNVPTQREIEIVTTIGNDCLVSKGLNAGERIVTDGVGKVTPGKAVKLADETPASADAESGDAAKAGA